MIKQFASRQFISFVITGGIAAAVNFGSRIVYSVWVDFSIAVVLAYLTGMVTAFILARIFVFTTSNTTLHRSALLFVVVNVFAILQTWAVSMFLAYWGLPALGVDAFVEEIAHGVGVLVPVFTSYLGHKHWSFKE